MRNLYTMVKVKKFFKTVFLVTTFFFGVLFTTRPVLAQSDFDKEYQEYKLALEDYKKAHNEYILKRSQYLKFETLKSEQDAFDATLILLEERDSVVINYIEALQAKFKDSVGVSEERLTELSVQMDQEREWFSSHKDKLSSAGSLEDLFSDSEAAKERYEPDQQLFYRVQAEMSLGRIDDFDERLKEVFGQIKNKVETIKDEERDEYKLSTRKIQIIDRWVLESENRLIRGQEKKNAGVEMVGELDEIGYRGVVSNYNQALEVFAEAQVFFKEVSSFLKEIVSEILVE